VQEAGQTLFGSPALRQREAFRVQGAITQLPDMLESVRRLQTAVSALEKRLEELATGKQKSST
jgi:hypothetical protein